MSGHTHTHHRTDFFTSTTKVAGNNCKAKYKYVGPLCYRAEMYAGRVACGPLVSHGKYADGTDRQTDGRQTITQYAFHKLN